MSRWALCGEERTLQVGRLIAEVVEPGDAVGLIGDLGAGKTCLVRGLMGGLYAHAGEPSSRGEQEVSSPTYTLMNVYDAPGRFDPVVHVDLYRLEDEDDLESTGYWDMVEGAGLLLVEWIDTLPGAWPGGDGLTVRLSHTDTGREVELSWSGVRGEERLAALSALLDRGGVPRL